MDVKMILEGAHEELGYLTNDEYAKSKKRFKLDFDAVPAVDKPLPKHPEAFKQTEFGRSSLKKMKELLANKR